MGARMIITDSSLSAKDASAMLDEISKGGWREDGAWL